jgi:hypothetical protein
LIKTEKKKSIRFPSKRSSLFSLPFQTMSAENIWIAASDGDFARVKHFLAEGANVNAQDELGYSPIHAAVSYGHTEVIQYLLSVGANANLTDEDGDTPLHACEVPAVATILLDAGADLESKNKEGKTPIEVAHEEEREVMVSFFATKVAGKMLPAGTEFTVSYEEQAAPAQGAGSGAALAPVAEGGSAQPFQFGAPAQQGTTFQFGTAPEEQKSAGKKQRK